MCRVWGVVKWACYGLYYFLLYYYINLQIKQNKPGPGTCSPGFLFVAGPMLPGSENTRIRPPRARQYYYILFRAILCRCDIMVCRSDALSGYIRAFYAFVVYVPYNDIKSPYGARMRLFSICGDGRRVRRATGSRTRAAWAAGPEVAQTPTRTRRAGA